MRRVFIAGNWKTNLRKSSAQELAAGIAQLSAEHTGPELAVCPPSCYLDVVSQALGDSAVGLGGQNMYHAGDGAYTGELSAEMLLDVGCKYVILGHSERRHILGESNQDINRKVIAALGAGLTPILCIGETLDQRESNQTRDVNAEQLAGSLAGLTNEQVAQVVIAYEPVWAIGTGKVATPEQAEEVHSDLRKLLEYRYNAEVAAGIRIQYGGSVKPDNAGELLAQPNIDGALVGGASLKADSFIGIAKAVQG